MVARGGQISLDSLGRSAGTSGGGGVSAALRRGRRQDMLSLRADRRGNPERGQMRGKVGWLRSKGMLEHELDDDRMMEDQMSDLDQDTINPPSRRGLFARVAGAAAIGIAGLTATSVRAATAADGPNWPGKLEGQHRQVVDAYDVNSGFPLAFAWTFLLPNPAPGAATAVVVLRHSAFPLALNHAMWAKYKIGESFKIDDPETKAPAVKNPFFQPKPGVLTADDFAIDRLLAKGTIFGGCNVALVFLSGMLAHNAGVSAEDAAKEWTANVIPGITLIPSGTWGVNRAQEAGCTYCAGG